MDDTPSFNFSSLSLGSHDISFRVMGEDGIWSDETFSHIRINQIPTARIDSISPVSPNVGESITFTGSGSDDGTIAGYSWRASIDGFLSSQVSFSRSSLSPGTHVISFRVREDRGDWSEYVQTLIEVEETEEIGLLDLILNPQENPDTFFLFFIVLIIIFVIIVAAVAATRKKKKGQNYY